MSRFFGCLLLLAGLLGIVASVYVGVWTMFIGGIVTIIEQIQTPPVQALDVAIGIVKILYASTVTGLLTAGSCLLCA